MRVIALIATYNEERFIGTCLEHLIGQGVEVYLLDNESRDGTVPVAEKFLGRGLIAIETLRRDGYHDLKSILRRKEELAVSLDANWFVHADPDEIRLPPRSDQTLSQALQEAQAAGYNAVNFIEYAFVPTRESPDHDHPEFQRTMRWYYPFLPSFPHRLNAWRKSRRSMLRARLCGCRAGREAELASSGGHVVRFCGVKMYPISFPMRHYLCLSAAHAVEKYGGRAHSAAAVNAQWHGWRARVGGVPVAGPHYPLLPSQAELRYYSGDDALDPSLPLTRHVWAEQWAESATRSFERRSVPAG